MTVCCRFSRIRFFSKKIPDGFISLSREDLPQPTQGWAPSLLYLQHTVGWVFSHAEVTWKDLIVEESSNLHSQGVLIVWHRSAGGSSHGRESTVSESSAAGWSAGDTTIIVKGSVLNPTWPRPSGCCSCAFHRLLSAGQKALALLKAELCFLVPPALCSGPFVCSTPLLLMLSALCSHMPPSTHLDITWSHEEAVICGMKPCSFLLNSPHWHFNTSIVVLSFHFHTFHSCKRGKLCWLLC